MGDGAPCFYHDRPEGRQNPLCAISSIMPVGGFKNGTINQAIQGHAFVEEYSMHTVKIVYWEDDGWWLGYLQDYRITDPG